MENSFSTDYRHIISVLEGAKSEIGLISNPEIGNLLTRLELDLTRHINFFKVRIGEAPDAEIKPLKEPLRKIMGKVVTTEDGKPAGKAQPILTKPRDIELKELKEKVEDIYGKFALTESDQLIDTLADVDIRAVAKKAGLPVTDRTPKRLTIDFINQIKDAILKQHESGRLVVDGLNDKLNTGTGNPDDNPDDNPGNGEGNGADGNLQMLTEISNSTNNAILEAYDENQIREFANMAGVEVNDKTKIDSKFITQLKEAIKALNAGNNK